jgi:uncharacterized protein (DUF427 family)
MAAKHPGPPFQQLTFHPSPSRVRATVAGAPLIDSRRALLVWEPGRRVPVYAVPREDVDARHLHADEAPATSPPRVAGETLRIDGRNRPGAAWAYDDPDLEGHVAFAWDAADHWYEEEEEVFVHPRDPFHTVEAMTSSRVVRVELDGWLIAASQRPVLLFETGLPTRYYLPREDFDAALLADSETHTECPYKGTASYHDVLVGEHRHSNLVWYYPDPLPAVAAIAERLAPFNERVDLSVDGERLARPQSPWSK